MVRKIFWWLKSRTIQVALIAGPTITAALAVAQDVMPQVRALVSPWTFVGLSFSMGLVSTYIRAKTDKPLSSYKA